MITTALAFLLLFQGTAPVRGGTAAGQLRTVAGGPAVAIRVNAIPAPTGNVKPSEGEEYYSKQAPVSSALTDNQGRYRLVNIPPGRYFIVADATYFPSTVDADRATVVTVTPGSAADNLDFTLLRQFGGKVSGRIAPNPDNAPEKATLSGPGLENILEIPVAADGTFEFGHVQRGSFLVDIIPTPPGWVSSRVQVGDGDVTGLQLVRPPTHVVTGKIIVQNGPLPRALLEFSTVQGLVNTAIKPDGTFRTRLHSARHRVELAGMPGGYSIASVRAGGQDATQGLTVGNADVSGIVITVAAPRQLPHVRGRISGLANDRLASTKVEMTGPIVGAIETAVRPDGSFEFAAATPGMYSLRLPQVPELKPIPLVVSWSDADVQVAVPGR